MSEEYNQWGLAYTNLHKADGFSIIIYLIMLLTVLFIVLCLPYIFIDVTVSAPGIIRPVFERAEVKPSISGEIEKIYYREGELVPKDSTIIRLRHPYYAEKKRLIEFEIADKIIMVHDLALLTEGGGMTTGNSHLLHSEVLRQELLKFYNQKLQQQLALQKTAEEYKMMRYLAKEKVIAQKEFFDKQIEFEQLSSAVNQLISQQDASWVQQLSAAKQNLLELKAKREELAQEERSHEIRASVTGIVQGLNGRYAGQFLQSGETVALVSPETVLVAECLVNTSDIGFIHNDSKVNIQIDAFNYRYYGSLSGRILSIDNDFSIINNMPVYKIRCCFENKPIQGRNKYTGSLKKGLMLQARFIIRKRTIWQLLFDKIDKRFNPEIKKGK
jgi:multidrug resistance efflux pump